MDLMHVVLGEIESEPYLKIIEINHLNSLMLLTSKSDLVADRLIGAGSKQLPAAS